jgi:hypothetical protein
LPSGWLRDPWAWPGGRLRDPDWFASRGLSNADRIAVRGFSDADRFATPEVLRAGACGACGLDYRGALLELAIEVGAPDPDTPADPKRWQSALVNPVADRLLIELQHLRDLCHGQKFFYIATFSRHFLSN